MSTVTLTKEVRTKFVMEYTEQVFLPRLEKLGAKIPTPKEVGEETEKQLRDCFKHLNQDTEKSRQFAACYGKVFVSLNLDFYFDNTYGYYSFIGDKYRAIYGKNKKTLWSVYVTNLLRPNALAYYKVEGNSTRYALLAEAGVQKPFGYIDEKTVNAWPLILPPCLDNKPYGGGSMVQIKRTQSEDGAVTKVPVIIDALKPILSQARQNRAVAYAKKVHDALDAYNHMLDEAATFATELHKVLQSVRTVKKLEADWPELWPEFKQITQLDPNMSGKAMITQANVALVSRTIEDFKNAAIKK